MSQKIIEKENSQKSVFLSQVKSQSQDDDSQTSRSGSQGHVLTQDRTALNANVSSQNSLSTQVRDASSQPVVPTLSQLSSQKSISTQSQGRGNVPSQNQSQLDEKENVQTEIDFVLANGTPLNSQNSQNVANSQNLANSSLVGWLLESGQSDSQGRDYLTNCSELLLKDQKSNKPETNE